MDDEARMSHKKLSNRDRVSLQRLSLSELGLEYKELFGREPDFSLGNETLIDRILNQRSKEDIPAFRFPP